MSGGAGRIVVLRPGALGDGVLALPVLASLRAARPEGELLIVGPPVFRLAVEAGLATAWMRFDDGRLAGLFTEGGRADALGPCDLCVAYTRSADGTLEANLKRSAQRLITWAPQPEAATHAVDHLLGALDPAGVPVATRQPRLPVRCGSASHGAGRTAEWLEEGRKLLAAAGVAAPFAAIHPGSGGRAKQWPVERFAGLARRLPLPVVWLLGPAEREQRALRQAAFAAGAVLDCPGDRELAGVLASAEVYVGNDSGVTHLAAAVGAPTVALFGPTDPAVWGPRGDRVMCLGGPREGGLTGVTVERVVEAVGGVGG